LSLNILLHKDCNTAYEFLAFNNVVLCQRNANSADSEIVGMTFKSTQSRQ